MMKFEKAGIFKLRMILKLIKLPRFNLKGALLSEVVLGMSIISLSILFIVNLPNSISLNTKSGHTSQARDVANQQIDYLRKKTYESLVNTPQPTTFFSGDLAKLPGASGVYEVTDCVEPLCVSGDLIKKVRVVVSWNEKEGPQTVELVTLVAKGGVAR